MQIYEILLNICGILLNNRGKTEKNGEFRGILWNFHGKCVENHSFLFLFFPFHSSTSCRMTRFRGRFRSFSVVFAVIPGENQRISEKNGEYRRNLSVFFPFLSTSLHFHSPIPRFYALQHVYCRYFVREVECLKYYCYFCT